MVIELGWKEKFVIFTVALAGLSVQHDKPIDNINSIVMRIKPHLLVMNLTSSLR
jgi:hypothetical protein